SEDIYAGQILLAQQRQEKHRKGHRIVCGCYQTRSVVRGGAHWIGRLLCTSEHRGFWTYDNRRSNDQSQGRCERGLEHQSRSAGGSYFTRYGLYERGLELAGR